MKKIVESANIANELAALNAAKEAIKAYFESKTFDFIGFSRDAGIGLQQIYGALVSPNVLPDRKFLLATPSTIVDADSFQTNSGNVDREFVGMYDRLVEAVSKLHNLGDKVKLVEYDPRDLTVLPKGWEDTIRSYIEDNAPKGRPPKDSFSLAA